MGYTETLFGTVYVAPKRSKSPKAKTFGLWGAGSDGLQHEYDVIAREIKVQRVNLPKSEMVLIALHQRRYNVVQQSYATGFDIVLDSEVEDNG